MDTLDLYQYFNIRPNIPCVYNDVYVNVRDMKYIIEYFFMYHPGIVTRYISKELVLRK